MHHDLKEDALPTELLHRDIQRLLTGVNLNKNVKVKNKKKAISLLRDKERRKEKGEKSPLPDGIRTHNLLISSNVLYRCDATAAKRIQHF